MPPGSGSILAEAGVTPAALRPANPAAAPRKPRRDVSIFMLIDPFLRTSILLPGAEFCAEPCSGPHLARTPTEGAHNVSKEYSGVRHLSGPLGSGGGRGAFAPCRLPRHRHFGAVPGESRDQG